MRRTVTPGGGSRLAEAAHRLLGQLDRLIEELDFEALSAFADEQLAGLR